MIKKGILLAGGTGTRLYPLTRISNKHCLPIYNKPMIYYPIETMQKLGIENVCIVLGGETVGDFVRILGDGHEFGLKFNYVYQRDAGGVAQAISLCEDFVDDDEFITILGDNIFFDCPLSFKENFEKSDSICGLVLAKVKNPEIYGVPLFRNGKIISIIEKPQKFLSDYAVTGLYAYTSEVFDYIKQLKPSDRNELEISEVHSNVLKDGKEIYWETYKGNWVDCASSYDSLLDASIAIRKLIRNE